MTLYLAIIESLGSRFTVRVRAKDSSEACTKALIEAACTCDTCKCLQVLPVGSYETMELFA
jgi:hypothetical protein